MSKDIYFNYNFNFNSLPCQTIFLLFQCQKLGTGVKIEERDLNFVKRFH